MRDAQGVCQYSGRWLCFEVTRVVKMRRSRGVHEVAAIYRMLLNGFRDISCKSVGSAHELSCPIPLG